jgi:intracellular septation protein A
MAEAGGAPENKGVALARYRRPFTVDGEAAEVVVWSRFTGLFSALRIGGRLVAEDWTPVTGPDSVRNHRLAARLPGGELLEVEAGYISWLSVGIAVRRDGVMVHESHPGRRIAMPDKAAKMAADPGVDMTQYKRNRVPIAVDIAFGILFFVVAKLTDLTTAALVGAAAGIALVVIQRFVKIDLVGGLALFSVLMLLVSAGLALAFQDDMAVKLRTTIVGLLSAALFLGDGFLGGKRLGKGLARYLPYRDIDPARLAIGIGTLGLFMAGLNYVVAKLASTDFWLFYTTFLDFGLMMLLLFAVFRYARRQGGRTQGG